MLQKQMLVCTQETMVLGATFGKTIFKTIQGKEKGHREQYHDGHPLTSPLGYQHPQGKNHSTAHTSSEQGPTSLLLHPFKMPSLGTV